jgi:predicted CXXCH cytochrome family protein
MTLRRATAALVPLLLWSTGAAALVDPHDDGNPSRCLSCHTRAITAEDARRGDLSLLKESIDEVCLICHLEKDCCVTGQRHEGRDISLGVTHPSDLDARSVPRTARPKTLPLQDGRITCATCHLHDRQKPADYKLVRMVRIKDTGIDWSPLCLDCHPTY